MSKIFIHNSLGKKCDFAPLFRSFVLASCAFFYLKDIPELLVADDNRNKNNNNEKYLWSK